MQGPYHRHADYDRVALAGTDQVPHHLLTQLYGENPADFVARRTALVKELRKEQPEVAREIASLRRPSVSVWAANRLHDVAPEDLEALLDVGHRLRDAQIAALEGRAVSDLRSLLSEHSASLQRAVDAAAGFLAEQGQGVSDVVLQRLQTTLRAVSLAGSDLPAALVAGRLVADQEPEGFGGFEGVALAPRPAERRPALRVVDTELLEQVKAARAAADTQARVAREARQEARALRARADQAAAEAAEAEERAGVAADQADAAEREAKQLEETP